MYILKSNDVPNALQEVTGMVNDHIAKLEAKASSNIPKQMPIGKYPSPKDYKFHDGCGNASIYDTSSWFVKRSCGGAVVDFQSLEELERRKNMISELIDKYAADCNKVDAENADAIANNKIIHEKIDLMMQHIGVKKSYSSIDKSSRSHYPKAILLHAGYLADLQRDVPTAVLGTKENASTLIKRLEDAYRTVRAKVAAEIRKKEQEIENVKASHEIALLRAKYTPNNAMSDKEDIVDMILSKDKYLRLAYYLEKNRTDWSDGCDYAIAGLNNFEVTDSRDQEIKDEIQFLINEWDGDGRCFRDCKWNYDTLYLMVENREIVHDLQKIENLTWTS